MKRLSGLMGVVLFFAAIFTPLNSSGADAPLKLTPMPINTEMDEDDPLFVPSLSTVYPARFYFSRKNEKGKYSIFFSKFFCISINLSDSSLNLLLH